MCLLVYVRERRGVNSGISYVNKSQAYLGEHEYANRDGASRTNENNIQIFVHVPRTQCTLFLVYLRRFSSQNFGN